MNDIKIKDKDLYYIGGVVRDEILDKPSFDIDLTYNGNAIEFIKKFDNLKVIKINKPFGTVRVEINNQEIDIASTRCEYYPQKGHLPVIKEIACSLKEDVLRRDFTINALAKSTLTNEIVDYCNGLNDLKTKLIRVLHDESFIDDPTRIIRALKFSIRFGFELEPKTKLLQQNYLNNINYDMSYARLKKELVETFNLNKSEAFDRFIDENIYKLVSPIKVERFDTKKLEILIEKYKPQNVWLVYIGLLPNISNLPLTKIEKKIIDSYNLLKHNENILKYKINNDNFAIYNVFKNIPLESIIMYSMVNPNLIEYYLKELKDIKLEITGDDLLAIGIKPSNKYKKCFDYILKQKLKSPDKINKQQEIELAKEFFAKITL